LLQHVPVVEHGGRWKTRELVMRNYWWLEVTKDVRKYVDGYDLCQRMENRRVVLVGKLMTNKILEKVWTYLTMDFITKLPLMVGKDAILVVYDRL